MDTRFFLFDNCFDTARSLVFARYEAILTKILIRIKLEIRTLSDSGSLISSFLLFDFNERKIASSFLIAMTVVIIITFFAPCLTPLKLFSFSFFSFPLLTFCFLLSAFSFSPFKLSTFRFRLPQKIIH